MKWPQKSLYTYNVRNGDKFILDEKKTGLGRIRTSSRGSNLSSSVSPPSTFNSPSSKHTMTFSLSPRFASSLANSGRKTVPAKSTVARNLFGRSNSSNKTQTSPDEASNAKNTSKGSH